MLDWECDGVCMHVCVCVCVCACECVCVCTHVQASGRVSSRPCGGAKSIGTEANENLPGKHLPLISLVLGTFEPSRSCSGGGAVEMAATEIRPIR